jgi:dTMP kinase
VRGAFISLEGIEGVGKSTNVAFTADAVRSAGFEVVTTREPGGTPFGERVREWILNGDHGALSADIEALLMFAARARHLDEVIRPALAAGRWVVCDRFTDATFAYQGGGRGASHTLLEALRREIQKGTEPDLTLLLDAPLDVGAARISNRKLAAEEPTRIKIVDAAASLERVQQQIATQVRALLDQRGARTA